MREAVFLRNNEKKWQVIEQKLSNNLRFSVDEIIRDFSDLSSDLAYSRTNYPNSKTTIYLNELTAHLYRKLYKRDDSWKKNILTFWQYSLPHAFYEARKEMLVSFLIFMVAGIIGIVSTHFDPEFPSIVLGEHYVNTTLKNIDEGVPMNIYSGTEEALMFFKITINNIRVALLTFIAGIFLGIGSYLILFQNGVMVGTFQWFFYTKGLFLTSFLTIWIHGTIEISSIIIAGGAGITIGNAFLFPGHLTRKASLIAGARRGAKIAIGLIPLFIIAGFLESFVTRHTEWSVLAKSSIILTSLTLIVYYFIIYPYLLFAKKRLA